MEAQNNSSSTSGEQSRTTLQRTGVWHRIWHFARIPVYVIAALYIAIIIYDIPHYLDKQKTEEVIAKIQAQKLTLKDVTGENLPPEPDPALKDATVVGVDANSNGIRDDVELAIFKLHPESAKIRAAELQYAMALQVELTLVFNSETLVAGIQEEERGDFCISNTAPRVNFSDKPEVIKAAFAVGDERVKEVENLVINTDARKKKQKEVLKFMTSYGSKDGQVCDLDPANLPN